MGSTIDGLFINRPSADYIGLFSFTNGANIENIGLTNVNITADDDVGGLVGFNRTSTISNSYSTGVVTGSGYPVGGLVGSNDASTISNSYSTGAVTGSDYYTGGLVGYNDASTINDSYSACAVSGDSWVGGLVGENYPSSTISNSHSTGLVTGTDANIGGLVGANQSESLVNNSYSTSNVIALGTGGDNKHIGSFVGTNNGSTIRDCYSLGDVTATGCTKVGAFIGQNKYNDGCDPALIENCYSIGTVIYTDADDPTDKGFVAYNFSGTYTGNFFDNEASNQTTATGATAKTTAEMKTQSTFTDAGWDFTTPIWRIDGTNNDGYPYLSWQPYPATVTTQAVTAIGLTTATGNGNITDLGSTNPTAHGVCWNTVGTPTIAGSHTDEGAAVATGAFTTSMTGLLAATTYYVKAYATNEAGTAYGNEVSFTTHTPPVPEINLKQNTTDIPDGGSYDFGNHAAGTHTDVVFTIENTGTADLTLSGSPIITITGADSCQFSVQAQPTSPVVPSGSTTFTIRFSPTTAGAKTASVAIGNNDSDENPYNLTLNATGENVKPTVTTQAVSSLGATTATGNGDITSLGSPNPTQHGVCWNMAGSPTVEDSKTEDGAVSTTGAFTTSMTGLFAETTYYVRAYATNLAGTAYGNEVSFTTNDGTGVPPDVQDAGPNGGDGNGDGIKDSKQTTVASLPSATGGGYITVAITGCVQIEQVQAHTYESVSTSDPGYSYPFGLVGFEIPCFSATVRIYYHGAGSLEGFTYRKYGPTPADWGTSLWYTMPGATFGTEVIGGATVPYAEFDLIESELGDDTNGDSTIFDQGGPAQQVGTTAIPTLNEWGMIILSLLMAVSAFIVIQRRQQA